MAKISPKTIKYLSKIIEIDNLNKGDIYKGSLLLKILNKKGVIKKGEGYV